MTGGSPGSYTYAGITYYGGNGRWEVTVDPATNLYTVYKNGAQVLTFNYASQEGASWRHCGAGVSRGTFIDSGEWDDLTMMDIV